MPLSRLELVFRGRVQGVGFRAHAQMLALRCGVRGWVRNEPDGSVRCIVEGEESSLQTFQKKLSSDMSRYIATHEECTAVPEGRFSSFTIQF